MKKITSLFILTLFIQLNAQYSTPDTGVEWNLDSIVLHSPSTVTVDDDVYTLHEGLIIKANDTFRLDKNLTLQISPDVEVEIEGTFTSDADEILITALDQANHYKGFWIYSTADVYFNNTRIEYGGGLRVITSDFLMENCELSNNSSGSSTGATISFSNGSQIVRNSIFRNNQLAGVSSGANTSCAATIENNLFEYNVQGNTNTPQINMGPSGAETLSIIGNTVIGDRNITMAGGIAAASLTGVVNNVVIKDNIVRDNRYGITIYGSQSTGEVINNIVEDNDTQNEPNLGGSGLSLYSTGEIIVTGNEFRRNLWGITVIGTSLINLGNDDEDNFNEGQNIFSENGNGGETYAIYNNTPNEIYALHNCWIEGQESTAEQVEDVIFHQPDDAALGLINYTPFLCGVSMSVGDILAKNDMTVFPNPNNGNFNVSIQEKGILSVYDLTGKLILNQAVNKGINTVAIEQKSGIYILKIDTGKGVYDTKVMVK